jgi:hypothetical protein
MEYITCVSSPENWNLRRMAMLSRQVAQPVLLFNGMLAPLILKGVLDFRFHHPFLQASGILQSEL